MRRALCLGIVLLCRPAVGQEGVRWQYIAPAECPTEQQFRDQVRERVLRDPSAALGGRKVHLGAEAPARGELSVQVWLEPSERRAFLVFREGTAPALERMVQGNTCAELVSGLALITALAFGAGQEPRAEASAPSGEGSPPVPPVPATLAARRPPGKEPAEAHPARAGRTPPDIERSRAGEAPASVPLDWEAGAGGWVNTWLAPESALGLDGFLRVAPESAGWSLRLAGLYASGTAYVGDRRAEFGFWGGRAEVCPISRPLSSNLLGEGCLAMEAGTLRGRGESASSLRDAASESLFWSAALIAGRLRANFAERISLEAQGELALPLVRHEFVFTEPRERIFLTPTVGFAGRVGVGIHFL
jgi:hypothetical protein